jgi:hypothetical protein
MAPEPEDDILNEKNPRPLDEDDIALLKTYVSATPVWISSPRSPGSRVLRDDSFSRWGLSAGLGGVLRAGLDGVWDRDASRILISSAVCEGFVLLSAIWYSGCVI